ncbi:hypothetical protein DL98DRAFT_150131 [Cadophora sp. DSE1049]|nr:hypothetical protein DL98DRAFT_150131 [Cadophora sp. DSE1049]
MSTSLSKQNRFNDGSHYRTDWTRSMKFQGYICVYLMYSVVPFGSPLIYHQAIVKYHRRRRYSSLTKKQQGNCGGSVDTGSF